MYEDWTANLIVVTGTALAVGAVVLIHYEGLSLLSRWLGGRREQLARRKVLYGIFGVLTLHIVEIWIFGFTLWTLLQFGNTGSVSGADDNSLLDAVYLSAETYTTVGFGDLAPVGPIRFIGGTMALTGLVLITWSASFTFLEMERFWRR
ncbi:MAG: ion channel [Gammaproteobacteria bacterium]